MGNRIKHSLTGAQTMSQASNSINPIAIPRSSVFYPVKILDGNGKIKKTVSSSSLRKIHWKRFHFMQFNSRNREKFVP